MFQLNISWASNDRKVVAFMMPNALRRREKSIVTKHVPSRAIQCVDMTASHRGHIPMCLILTKRKVCVVHFKPDLTPSIYGPNVSHLGKIDDYSADKMRTARTFWLFFVSDWFGKWSLVTPNRFKWNQNCFQLLEGVC